MLQPYKITTVPTFLSVLRKRVFVSSLNVRQCHQLTFVPQCWFSISCIRIQICNNHAV